MKRKMILISLMAAVLILVTGCISSPEKAEDLGSHENGDLPYEWSAVYELDQGAYKLEFQESEHDPSIKIAFLLEGPNRDELDHLAYHIMEVDSEEFQAGSIFKVQDQYAYNLQLNSEGTHFFMVVDEPGRYVVYTEHFAWEFNMLISDEEGNEVPGENSVEHTEPHSH